jgi:precorrin-3B C17-methyltransferase
MSLAIVGLGPGGPEHRTAAAERAVREADVVVGYSPYVDQCADLLRPDQLVIRGHMGEEVARAEEALAHARTGARVALVSSGDAGVHGMAARTLALAPDEAVVVPGVTAALAVAARVGAPLADDWATLSLSDLHTPWATIERRLVALAASGIALALYNPRSSSRIEPFARALTILRAARATDTPVIVASDVARPAETIVRTTLGALDPAPVTMRSLVLVAGESAAWAGDWLVAVRS